MPTPRGSLADFPWRSWGAVVTVGLLLLETVKLAVMFAAGPAPLADDAGMYWKLGEQVAAGDFWMQANPVGFRTPGYPWFLGAIRYFCGLHAWQCVIALQHIAVGATTVLTGWWTFRLTGRVALMNFALILRVISFANVGYASTVLTEACFEPAFLLVLIVLTTPVAGTTDRHWWLVGVLFAGAFLFRPAVLAMVPAIVVASLGDFAWPPTFAVIRRKSIRRWGIVLVGCVLCVGPWCLRNAVVFGRPVPMIFLGRELWMSVYGPGSPPGPMMPETPEADRLRLLAGNVVGSEDWRVNWSISAGLTQSGMSDAEADAVMQTVAWQGLQRDPFRWGARSVWRTVDFWRTTFSRELLLYGDTQRRTGMGDDQHLWGSVSLRRLRARVLDGSLENRLLMIELGSLLGILGAIGLSLHPRTKRPGWILGVTLLGFGVMTGALELPNYRFRMVLEPLLIVGSVAGLRVWSDILHRGLCSLWSEANEAGAGGEANHQL